MKKLLFGTLALALLLACSSRQLRRSGAAAQNVTSITLQIPSYPLRDDKDLNILMQQIGDAQVVLLGEATHGTAEFYNWRAALSKRLIQEKGFDFIAVEGEWADSYRVNQFIKGPQKDSAAAVDLLRQYTRWPTWMWGNYEVASLVTWLNKANQGKKAAEKTGFYGLDVYCLWESMSEIMPYLESTNTEVQKAAKKVHQCFQPYSADAYQYAAAVAAADASCRGETARLWRHIQKLTGEEVANTERDFVLQQNALVALNGENYYRTMVSNDAESWNIRDRHMAQTLQRLMELHGKGAKAIVWEHNTHVGDARYTDMAAAGQTNVGELVRKAYGEEKVYIVGFGTYSGSVIAAQKWGAPIKRMEVPPAAPNSWEDILHRLSPTDKILLSKELRNNSVLNSPVSHRAIGVVYQPEYERNGNYIPSVIPRRYDAFIFIDSSNALHPIHNKASGNEPPDTYPWGT